MMMLCMRVVDKSEHISSHMKDENPSWMWEHGSPFTMCESPVLRLGGACMCFAMMNICECGFGCMDCTVMSMWWCLQMFCKRVVGWSEHISPKMKDENLGRMRDHGSSFITCVFPIGPREGGPPFAMSVPLVRSLLEPAGFEATLVQDSLPLEEQHRRPGDPLQSVLKRGTALVTWRAAGNAAI